MTAGALPHPPQRPVKLPPGVSHGTWRAHRKLKCRCKRCQEWSREADRNRPPRGKNKPREPGTGWYVCANRWGATYTIHEYNWHAICLRCGIDRPTAEHWERVWEQSK